MTTEPHTITCTDLDAAINQYKAVGYRLDMIFPADSPREASMSMNGESVRLVLSSSFSWPTNNGEPPKGGTPNGGTQSEWITGRAGMEYRDLIPGRLGGKVIASHIRLTNGGEVPDYVHYHKVDFQMIYCKRGRIKVVYEYQGEPFWLETGDCVLQPPEIRHRVLYAEAGAEVIEVSMPAEHETWVEHDMDLPNGSVDTARDFSGQLFVLSRAEEADWELSGLGGFERREMGIDIASGRVANVQVFRPVSPRSEGVTNAVCEPGKGILICLEDGSSILIDFLSDRSVTAV